MTTLCRKLMLSVYMLLGLSGCLGSLVSTSSPPRYFQISYSYKPEKCIGKIGGTLKIWPFSASAPYDRDEMIVLDSFRQVHFSPLYRWVSFPGNMISDMLLRDMSRSTLFNQVVTAGNSAETGLEMGGHVYEFAWRQEAGSGHAVLDVEISLWKNGPKRTIVFRRNYRFNGKSSLKSDSETFAKEMSGLLEMLSNELYRDICAAFTKDSSSPVDD